MEIGKNNKYSLKWGLCRLSPRCKMTCWMSLVQLMVVGGGWESIIIIPILRWLLMMWWWECVWLRWWWWCVWLRLRWWECVWLRLKCYPFSASASQPYGQCSGGCWAINRSSRASLLAMSSFHSWVMICIWFTSTSTSLIRLEPWVLVPLRNGRYKVSCIPTD